MRKTVNGLKKALALIVSLVLLLLPCACEGGFGALGALSFGGVNEPEYGKVDITLPIHAGYTALEGNDAYADLASDKQREAYGAIEKSLYSISLQSDSSHCQMAIARIPRLSSGEIFMVKEAVLADHPEVFWITGDYTLGYNVVDGNYLILYSGYSYETVVSMIKAMERSVSSALKEVSSNLGEFERELLIHDILVRDVTYDSSAVTSATKYTGAASSYGALVNRSALCSGYAKAAKLLLNRVGIACGTVKGTADGVGHMWNIVKISGDWYHLDVTWDDPVTLTANSARSYDYFNLSDKYINADHVLSQGYDKLTEELIASSGGNGLNFYNFDLPECSSYTQNYYVRKAVEISDLGSGGRAMLEALLGSAILSGDNMIYISFPEYMEQSLIDEWLDDALVKAAASENRFSSGRKINGLSRSDRVSDSNTPWTHVYYIVLNFNS